MIKLINYFKIFTHDSNIRNGALFSIFSIINSGFNFLLLFVLANVLGAEEYGHLNLYNNFVTIVVIISSLGTSGYISVVYFRQRYKFAHYVSSISLLTSVVLIICLTLCSLEFTHGILGLNTTIILLGISYCFFQFYITLVLDYRRLREETWKYGILTLSLAILNLLFLVLLLPRYPNWETRVFVQVLINSIVFLYCIIVLYKHDIIHYNKIGWRYIREALLYGLPLIPHLLTVWLRQGLDSYIINYYYDAETLGHYTFALNFYSIIYIIGSAFNNSNSVHIYKLLTNGYNLETRSNFNSYNYKITLLFLFLTLSVIVGAFVLIPFIFPKYTISVRYITPLCFAGFFQIIYLLYVNILYFFGKTRVLMYITFSLSILYSSGSFVITRYSLLALSIWLLIINILISLLVMDFSKRELSKHFIEA